MAASPLASSSRSAMVRFSVRNCSLYFSCSAVAPANESSRASCFSAESSDWWSCGPWRSTRPSPSSFSTLSVVGLPLMNCRLVPLVENTRFRINCPSSHGSTPCSSSHALSGFNSRAANTASTVQLSAPERMSDLSARSPSTSLSAPTMMLFPEPVSPVTAMKPGPSSHSSSSTRARLRIRSETSMGRVTKRSARFVQERGG